MVCVGLIVLVMMKLQERADPSVHAASDDSSSADRFVPFFDQQVFDQQGSKLDAKTAPDHVPPAGQASTRTSPKKALAQDASPLVHGDRAIQPIDLQKLKRTLANSQKRHVAQGSRNRVATKAAVHEAVGQLKPKLKACYERLLVDFPEAEGKMLVKMKMDALDGIGTLHEISKVEVGEGALFEQKMRACIKESVGEISFPFERDDGSIDITYPFHFKNTK